MAVTAQPRDILLTEDHPLAVRLLQEAFQTYGQLLGCFHRVGNNEAVLAFLQQHGVYAAVPRPHLPILDFGLPKLSSWQVLQTLRTTPAVDSLLM